MCMVFEIRKIMQLLMRDETRERPAARQLEFFPTDRLLVYRRKTSAQECIQIEIRKSETPQPEKVFWTLEDKGTPICDPARAGLPVSRAEVGGLVNGARVTFRARLVASSFA